ncbi:MAG: hypothetical protein WA397_13130 [Roseiarcus sp.]
MVLDLASLLASGVIDQLAFDAHSKFAEMERERAERNQRLFDKITRTAPRPVGFAAVAPRLMEQRWLRRRKVCTVELYARLERRWRQRLLAEMRGALATIGLRLAGVDKGLPSSMMLKLLPLIAEYQRSHSLRVLAPRPKAIIAQLAALEKAVVAFGNMADHDNEDLLRRAACLAPVPSLHPQALPKALGELRAAMSAVAELAPSARRECEDAWPSGTGGGGVSPLVGAPNQRLADGLMKAIFDELGPECCQKISSRVGRPFDRLLKAVAYSATGEKPKENSFKDALTALPERRDALVKRPGPKARREQAAAARDNEAMRKKVAREKAEVDRTILNLAAADTYEQRRMLKAIRARAGHDRATRIEHLATMASSPASSLVPKTWVKPLSTIKSGQPS